jgi:alpha-L-rhamnosidase
MFSDLSAFMYKYVGGISPDEGRPGFRHINLRPAVDCGLQYASAKHESMYGLIECRWENTNGEVQLDIKVPGGTTATLILPLSYDGRIGESGRLLTGESVGDKIHYELASGYYRLKS